MLPANTLFAFALEREAKPFRRRRPGSRIVVTGAGPQRATDALGTAIKRQMPNAVVMSGFAGALIPELEVGNIVLASEISVILDPSIDMVRPATVAANSIKLALLGHKNLKLPRAYVGRILCAERIIGRPAEKQELAKKHVAVAVDMESIAAARVCLEHDIPCYVVRVISDVMATELSSELIELLDGGSVSISKSLRAVIKKPSLVGEFRRLACDTRRAADELGQFLTQFL